MIKYGAFVTYKCAVCGREEEVPLHLKENPPLEKYANYCTHSWEITGEIANEQTDTEEDSDLQPSEIGS